MKDSKHITVVIADDHPMLLRGLNDELTEKGYHVLGQAENGIRALQLIIEHQPMVALIDIDMPVLKGLEVIKKAKLKTSSTRFILLSFHRETTYVIQAKTLSIDGYLLKEDSFDEIEKCIHAVINGEQYFSNSFKGMEMTSANKELRMLRNLTPSERKILKLIAKSYSSQEMADSLYVSIRTIEKHRSNIISKLQVNPSTHSLTHWALENKDIILNFHT
ncbi:MAG: DNA-binding response regulator [Cytophagaceae bacterium]|nr:DNA-binding response regulator [Cytophagaceae bacterium]|tara:strand:- start:14027 stop:14683 length:657 start_codon:yes stop_codon:yes gene_type:complete